MALALAVVPGHTWVYETPSEFQASGDFDGNGLADVIVVEKATGGYRIGYQPTTGATHWAATRASGIQGVSGVSVGRLLAATRDTLACTEPEANRVTLLDATDPAAAPCQCPSICP